MPVRPPGLLRPRPDNTLDAVVVDEQGSSQATQYPNEQIVGHDLASGDLVIGPLAVNRTESVMLVVNSTSGNTWSASVDWETPEGDVLQEESASDLNLSSATEDWARLIRKGPQVEITITDESGAANNSVNAYVDASK